MNCQGFQQQLHEFVDGTLEPSVAEGCSEHLRGCSRCHARLQAERVLRDRLRQLLVVPPRQGFARRVLSAARARRRPGRREAVFALAASLLLVAALALLLPGGLRSKATVLVNADQVQPVRLVFNSPQALSGVTLHVGLPDGVELARYPGVRELTWQADFKAGANLLALPVTVRGKGGVITAEVSYGDERRQFAVTVRPTQHPGSARAQGGELATCAACAAQEIIGHA